MTKSLIPKKGALVQGNTCSRLDIWREEHVGTIPSRAMYYTHYFHQSFRLLGALRVLSFIYVCIHVVTTIDTHSNTLTYRYTLLHRAWLHRFLLFAIRTADQTRVGVFAHATRGALDEHKRHKTPLHSRRRQ